MIVDTSALVAIVKNEPEAERCKTLLLATTSARMSAANLLETFIVVDESDDSSAPAVFEVLLDDVAIDVAPVTEAHARLARQAYQRSGRRHHPAGLNYGDCFAYALARATDEPLLFVGNDFAQTDIPVA